MVVSVGLTARPALQTAVALQYLGEAELCVFGSFCRKPLVGVAQVIDTVQVSQVADLQILVRKGGVSYLQVLLGRICACSRVKRDKSNWACRFPVL